MTKEEAEQVLSIMPYADGGCRYCAGDLMMRFVDFFPEYKELAKNLFEKEFQQELYKND
jgi:hypothetical protein